MSRHGFFDIVTGSCCSKTVFKRDTIEEKVRDIFLKIAKMNEFYFQEGLQKCIFCVKLRLATTRNCQEISLYYVK